MSINPANTLGTVPAIPDEVISLDEIIKLPGLLPGMEVLLTGSMADPKDIHMSKGTRTTKKRLARNVHHAVVLEVDREPGSESITIAMMRSFGHSNSLEGKVVVADRAPWMPISPALREEGTEYEPIKTFEVENNAPVENTTPCWLYVRKKFRYKVGTQLPGAAYVRGPTRLYFPAESLAAVKAALNDKSTEDVKGIGE